MTDPKHFLTHLVMMMNIVALCLVLTTLVTAGVWSPPAEKQNDVIVKDGHRGVVVEYEQEDGKTRVSVSSSSEIDGERKGYVSDVKEKLNDVVEHAHKSSVREIVCDAYGKCKHRLASALGRTNEMAAEQAHEAADKAADMAYEAKEKAKDAAIGAKDDVEEGVKEVVEKVKRGASKTKETVEEFAHGAKEKAKDAAIGAKEAVEGGVRETSEKVKRGASKAKEMVEESAYAAKEKAKDAAIGTGEVLEEGVKEAVEKAKRGASKTKETVKESTYGAKEKAKDAATATKEGVREAAEKAKRSTSKAKEAVDERAGETAEKAKGVKKEMEHTASETKGMVRNTIGKVLAYLFSAERLGSFMGTLHLLGFATAYGTTMWITFASSYVLAGVLPRQQFAMLQSKIYPVYFKAVAFSVGMALLGHVLSQRNMLSLSTAEMLQGLNLLSSLLMILVNFIYLEPRASKVMFERLKWEKEEGRGGRDEASTEPRSKVVDTAPKPPGTAQEKETVGSTTPGTAQKAATARATSERPSQSMKLSESLKLLNSYSSSLNVLTLMSLTWHLVHLSHKLHTAC